MTAGSGRRVRDTEMNIKSNDSTHNVRDVKDRDAMEYASYTGGVRNGLGWGRGVNSANEEARILIFVRQYTVNTGLVRTRQDEGMNARSVMRMDRLTARMGLLAYWDRMMGFGVTIFVEVRKQYTISLQVDTCGSRMELSLLNSVTGDVRKGSISEIWGDRQSLNTQWDDFSLITWILAVKMVVDGMQVGAEHCGVSQTDSVTLRCVLLGDNFSIRKQRGAQLLDGGISIASTSGDERDSHDAVELTFVHEGDGHTQRQYTSQSGIVITLHRGGWEEGGTVAHSYVDMVSTGVVRDIRDSEETSRWRHRYLEFALRWTLRDDSEYKVGTWDGGGDKTSVCGGKGYLGGYGVSDERQQFIYGNGFRAVNTHIKYEEIDVFAWGGDADEYRVWITERSRRKNVGCWEGVVGSGGGVNLVLKLSGLVMSSASYAVTYTSVYTDSEPGRVFCGADEEISDGGIPRVIVYGYDGLPMQPDEHVFPVEEKPLPPVDSPTVESPGIALLTNPLDGGDDGYDDDDDSSGNDVDDEEEDEEDEEEEHLAPVDSAVVIPTVEPVSPPEGTEPVIPSPSTDITTIGARITVRLQASISLPPEAEVERLLVILTPSPSPPISLSPPSAGERLARDDLPESELPPRKRLCLSTLGSRYEVGESSTARPIEDRGIDYGFVSTVDAEARRQGISEVGYGIRDTWVNPAKAVLEIAPMTLGEVNTRVTKLAELHEHDTHD
ncbi:hypothetical protein Tco_0079780 [Tanacetum coccineum]